MKARARKIIKWTGIVLLSPIVLFVVLTVLLYIPPIQNWAVKKVAAYASEKTGMQITVEHVDIGFPLDIGADGVLIIQEGDTVADIQRLVADVKFWPLFDSKIELDQLELNTAKINTREFIEDMRVVGRFKQFAFKTPEGIDLKKEIVNMHDGRLKDADLHIMLSDTAIIDSTDIIQWKIKFDCLAIENSHFTILLDSAANFEQPTTTILAYMGNTKATDGLVDLAVSSYAIKHIDWRDGALRYDSLFALSNMDLVIDDFYSKDPLTKLDIKEGRAHELGTGLEVSEVRGPITLDADGVRMPDFFLRTPYSSVKAKVDMDYSALEDSIDVPGLMDVSLDVALGKPDLMRFMDDMPSLFKELWPDKPLTVKGSIKGNVKHAEMKDIVISLPTAFRAEASGNVEHLYDAEHLLASLNWKIDLEALRFLAPLNILPTGINIPSGLSMEGRVQASGPSYSADIKARHGNARLDLKGSFNQRTMAYDADINAHGLNVTRYVKDINIPLVNASVKLRGQGTDFLSKNCWLEADATIDQLRYETWNLEGLSATARLNDGHAIATVNSHNALANGSIHVDALLGRDDLKGVVVADMSRMDLYALGLSDDKLTVGLCGHIDIESDLNERHAVSGRFSDLYIRDSLKTFRPEDVGLLLKTRPDTTYVRLQSGNLIVKMDASGGYKQLADQLSLFADSLSAQFSRRSIDQPLLKTMLPTMRLSLESGRDNPLADILKVSQNIDFKEMKMNLTASPTEGLNGQAHIYSLNLDSTRIDTLRLTLRDKNDGLNYQAQVTNNRRNPQFVFNALLDGRIYENGASIGLRYYDSGGDLGIRVGAYATAEADGIRFRLVPERPTIGYKEFNLNLDNFLYLRSDLKLQAKVDLIADDGTGVKVYSENQDSTLLQDLTISLNRLNLDDVTSGLPYLPHITGMLNGDYHLMMNNQRQISVASDMEIRHMTYEDCEMGNVGMEFVYLQREDDTHVIDGILKHNSNEIGMLKGEYHNDGSKRLDANLELTRMPMMLVNGFIPDQLCGFEGYLEGNIGIKGTLKRPNVNGEIYLDSAYLVSQPYGVRLRFDYDPVVIEDSKLKLENFTVYAYNDNPLNIQGDVDFSNTDRMRIDLQMKAQNMQLINARQTARSIAYGKMFVNIFADMHGTTDMLRMNGKLDILGTTDLHYILLDSPLSTDSQLDELVKFTDFTDTTQTVVERPVPDGLDVSLDISIDPGAHARCDLNAEQTNYVDLFGGGDLRMRYNGEGINLMGRYTVNSGTMKYSLPVIPLTTFTIQEGSYVEFTGDPTNPTLNLTATERKRATVGQEGEQSRSVTFDCGVVVTKTLNDMGLEFIISAPEDLTVNNDLQTMGSEQRGKLAVTMLTTGMYLADGNTSGFSMNSALNSFLENEINNITGNALKTIDLTIGLDNSTDASGQSHTDYSFKFAKRFWNNRLKVQIGGLVSTGAEAQGQNQSFFDNVTMEYRLSPTANQYVKLFYNQNAYDWIEGYTSEYGGGFIWRRKLEKFGDIFRGSTSPMDNEERIDALPADSIGRKEELAQ